EEGQGRNIALRQPAQAQRDVSVEPERVDAMLYCGPALPRQDDPGRPVLDRRSVRRRLAGSAPADVVAARALTQIIADPAAQGLDAPAKPHRLSGLGES